jgi:hypothetical protein
MEAAHAALDASQLAAIQKLNTAQEALDGADIEFTPLKSGGSFREFRPGRGEKTVAPGDVVTLDLILRAEKLSTTKEVGGIKYLDLRGYIATLGADPPQLPPELEEGIVGMRKGAIRRVEVPSTAIYRARKSGSLPIDMTQKNTARVFKTDATSIAEVKVNSILSYGK